MKRAVILAGSHWSGKNSTINDFLKPMLKSPDGKTMGPGDHKFILNTRLGYILSQSFAEALKEFLVYSEKYFRHELLIFSGRPETKPGSKHNPVREALEKAGYLVTAITIKGGDDKQHKAKEIFDVLNSNLTHDVMKETST
jgi:hypothetical protein